MLERTRRKCLDLRDRFYPTEQWPSVIHQKAIRDFSALSKVHLEIGCGRDAKALCQSASWYGYSVGIDLEVAMQSLRRDCWILLRADAHQLPVADSSIDVVSMADVAEHLADPPVVFAECARILKPGGVLIVSTVNQWFPPIVLGRFLPHRLRQIVNRAATDTAIDDTFPAFYRANTRRSLMALATQAGLTPLAFRYLPHHPRYLMFSATAYRVGVFVERFMRRFDQLQGLRHILHAVFVRAETKVP